VSGATALALGAHHSCALLTTGKVTCWGGNYRGQAAPTRRAFAVQPAEIPGLDGVTEIAAGPQHTCARKADGAIVCWGDDRHGELGVGGRGPRRGLVTVGKKPKAPPPADPACPMGRVHVDDWQAWQDGLEGAPDEQNRAEILERAGFEPFPPDDGRDRDRECDHETRKTDASAVDLKLVDDGPAWKLVEVRFVLCAPPPDPEEAGRVDGLMRSAAHIVLRPLGGGDYCPVPEAGGSSGGFQAPACMIGETEMHNHDEEPGEMTPVDLVSAKHKTLRFDQSTGTCLGFRMGEAWSTTSFYDVANGPKGPTLARVFHALTAESAWDTENTRAFDSIELAIGKGAFPRNITAVNQTSCDALPGKTIVPGCKPAKTKTVYVYRNGAYVDPTARPPRPKARGK
jgi:hypothetical protein